MNNIVVSVCMITYNHENFIREAIDGVLMQKTDFPIELIIGEDCSTDSTRKIIVEYAEKHPDIIRPLLPERNMGMMKNFIKTMEAAKGKYIALCEGDDYWTDPYKLQKQVDFLEANEEYSLCFHNAEILYDNFHGNGKRVFRKYDKSIYTARENIYKWIIPTASVVFRNVLKNNEFPDYFKYVIHGDFALFMWLGDYGDFFCINEIMSIYRRHASSLMTQLNNTSSVEKLIVQYEAMQMYFGRKYFDDFNKRIAAYYLQIAVFNIRSKQYRQCLSHVISALKYDIIIFSRNRENADYLKYTTFKSMLKLLLLTLYKSQSIIRRNKFKSFFKWKRYY